MSWKRAGVIVVAVLAIGGAFAGAYAFAASRAPDDAEARAVRAEASDATYAVAQLGAYADGLRFGLEQGVSDGGYDGEQQGRAAGRSAVDSVLAERSYRARGAQPQPQRTLPGSGGVLVVGDSLEVLTSPYLKQYLPGVPLTVNAEGGYNSNQIFELFSESYEPSQSVVVFDAGTNDNPSYPEILAGNLDKVASAVGGRCLVVPTIHGLIVDGVDNTGKNRVVRSFAAEHPKTQMPNWAGFVEQHPELMQADDLHPIAEGADARARLIARGVRACLAMDPRFGG